MRSNGKSPSFRVLLYGHDTFGLGHFRRHLSIAYKMAERVPDSTILCLTGSPCSDSFATPANFDCVRLPAATKNAGGDYVSRALSLSIEELTRLRAGIIDQTVRRFEPDLLLVDHSPLGMRGELRSTLERLRGSSKTRTVLGLRDIVDDPESVKEEWASAGVYPALETLYDRILVYGEREVFDLGEQYNLPDAVRRELRYTGYVYRNGAVESPAETRSRYSSGDERLVTVTVGGGGDGEHVIDVFLRSLEGGGGGKRTRGVVLAGPLMAEERFRAFQDRVRERDLPAEIVRFTPSALDLFAASDLVVSMGGYNTMCEVLALERPSIVIPRVFPRREQIVRASRFQELGLVEVIHPSELSPRVLGELMRKCLDRGDTSPRSLLRGSSLEESVPKKRLDFRGLDVAVRELGELLSEDEREKRLTVVEEEPERPIPRAPEKAKLKR